MPLSKDPDTLRIPAFMRKRSLRAGARRPLLLTALDRKQAGVLPAALQEPLKFARPKAKTAKARMVKVHTPKMRQPKIQTPKIAKPNLKNWGFRNTISPLDKRGSGSASPSETKEGGRARAKRGELVGVKRAAFLVFPRIKETFSAPLLDFYAETLVKKTPPQAQLSKSPRAIPKKLRQKEIGEIIHYYDKIKVAVIKLSGTLGVGDCIRYELFEPIDDEETYEEIVESMEIDRSPVFKAGRGKEIGIKLRKKPRVGSAVAIA